MSGESGLLVDPLPGWNVRGYSFLERSDRGELHPGLDLNIGAGDEDLGAPVVACADGVVVARREWDGGTYGFGNAVLVAHELPGRGGVGGQLRLWSLYAHLEGFDDSCWEGAAVVARQRLGACGSSGYQAWAHVHFELRYRGPEEGMPVEYWGGRLDVGAIVERYADPGTALRVGRLIGGPGVDVAALVALQADRDYNYALKMAFEARLRELEARRRLARGTVERLIAGVAR